MMIQLNLKKAIAFMALILVAAPLSLFAQNTYKAQVVAHRGYWNTEGSFQNTITALKKSAEINAYGCELDVNMTTDGVLVVCHGPKVGDVADVQDTTFARMQQVRFKNGDGVPTLDEFVKCAKELGHRLILEVKTHPAEKRVEVVTKVVELIKRYEMENLTEFIAFNYEICKELHKQMPGSMVQYLLGDKTPAEIYADGIMGIDYEYSTLSSHINWIQEAHDLGMVVNVWTVDPADRIEIMVKNGVDFITTNQPVLAQQIIGALNSKK